MIEWNVSAIFKSDFESSSCKLLLFDMELIELLRFERGGKLVVVLVLLSSRGGLCLFW